MKTFDDILNDLVVKRLKSEFEDLSDMCLDNTIPRGQDELERFSSVKGGVITYEDSTDFITVTVSENFGHSFGYRSQRKAISELLAGILEAAQIHLIISKYKGGNTFHIELKINDEEIDLKNVDHGLNFEKVFETMINIIKQEKN